MSFKLSARASHIRIQCDLSFITALVFNVIFVVFIHKKAQVVAGSCRLAYAPASVAVCNAKASLLPLVHVCVPVCTAVI